MTLSDDDLDNIDHPCESIIEGLKDYVRVLEEEIVSLQEGYDECASDLVKAQDQRDEWASKFNDLYAVMDQIQSMAYKAI